MIRKSVASKQIDSAEAKAQKIVDEAKNQDKELQIKAKNKAIEIIEAAKKEEKERRDQTIKQEERIASREKSFDSKLDQLVQKQNFLETEKEKISQMTIDCFAAESVVSMVAHFIDSGVKDYSIEAACSKVFGSEALWRGVNESLQIAGGNGYMKEFPYERMLRDSRINMIFEGTNEILRL